MKGISLQISNENAEKNGISPELIKILTDEGWTIDNVEFF